MSSIDERVVNMKFNNSQFEAGIKQTKSSLDNLKQGLNLDASRKSLEGLDEAGKKFSLAGVTNGVENVAAKFSALSVIGITALATIASSAVQTGMQLVSSLTIDPIKSGFAEYEAGLTAMQTIIANTKTSGTSIDQVNAALAQLNVYANQTIYSFGDMTTAIGLFTAQGVNLNDSMTGIKGIFNLVSLTGGDAEKANSAIYQLSQAIASGTVKAQDWISVVNAGIGGTDFQNQLIQTAKVHGTNVDAMIKKQGSFKDSLQDGWLTSKVLLETLSQYTGDLSAEQLKGLGYNEKQIQQISDLGATATNSATKLKSYTQLMDTLVSNVVTGWATSFKIVIGTLDEASDLWTRVGNSIGGIMQASSDTRNQLLSDWKALGGRDMLIQGIVNVFQALVAVVTPIKQAFTDLFPAVTAKQLFAMTTAFTTFMEKLIIGKKTSEELKSTFRGVFAVLDIGRMIIAGFWGVLVKLFGSMHGGASSILGVTSSVGEFLVKIRDTIKNGDGLTKFFDGLAKVLIAPVDMLRTIVKWLGEVVVGLGKLSIIQNIGKWFSTAFDSIRHINFDGIKTGIADMRAGLMPLKGVGDGITTVWQNLGKVFQKIGTILAPLGKQVADTFKGIGSSLGDALKNLDFNAILGIIRTGLLGGVAVLIAKLIKTIKGGLSVDVGGGFIDSIKNAFGGLTTTLGAMQTNLKSGTLLKIAEAVALLTVSVVALSMINSAKLSTALAGIALMMGELSAAMVVMGKMTGTESFARLPVLAATLILLAIAVDLLAVAVSKLAKLDWNELSKGLVGVIILLGGLAGAAKLMSANTGGMISAGIGMIAVAFAIKILASAVADFSKLNWDQIGRGLAGVGAVLTALTLFTRLAEVNRGAVAQSAGLILLGVALKVMATAVKDFADMDSKQLERGLGALSGALGVLAVFTRVSDPEGILRTGAAMVILGGALKIIATAVKDFAGMNWDQIGRGLAGMAGALLLITLAMNLMPPNMPLTALGLVVVGAALKIIASALKDMGGMSWEQIGKSLVVLAGSLVILAGALYLMSGALPGAAALIVAAFALSILAPALATLGKMSWDEIGRGLTILAASLVLIALGGVLLIPAIPGLIGLGIAASLIGLGALLAGVGLLAFSAGLAAFAVAGSAGTVVLVAMVTSMLGLIPYAMTQVGLGIIAFSNTIATGGPSFIAAMTTLLLSLLTAINNTSPAIVSTLVNLIWLLLQTLVDNGPRFANAGFQILIDFLNGIGNNIGAVVNSAVNIVVNFLNAIGSPDNVQRMINAGYDLVLNLINGVANGIRDHQQAMNDAGANLGAAVADGMTGGMASKVSEVATNAFNLGQIALDALKRATDSHSPSREAHKIGGYFGDGFVLGLAMHAVAISAAASDLGKTALSSLKDSISGLGESLNGNMDVNPTIRPVLDLSSIKKDSGLIGDMLTPTPLAIDGTYAKATTLAKGAPGSAPAPKDGAVPVSGTKIELIQNNNSPKALSTIEIYRQTKNLISAAKGLVEA